MKRVVVYTRKSTTLGLQKEFNSLEAQREACEAYAKSQGWSVTEVYEDGGFTGANIERPGFQELLRDVEARKVDLVLVYKVDRLSRSLLDFAKVMDRFAASGAAFASVTQNFSTADAMGRLTLNILMSFAEFEREMISELTRDKIAAARKRGKWTGGQVPLGYDVESGKLVVNELEAVAVRRIFEVYAATRSILAVMRALNESGASTKVHESKAGRLRTPKAWTQALVLRVLRNPLYAGRMRAGAHVVDGEQAGIVDPALFDAVQAKRPPHGGRRDERYVLRGLLRCACGATMVPATATKGHRYYRCSRRDKEGPDACSCLPLGAVRLEEAVLDQLRQAARLEQLSGQVFAAVHERLASTRNALEFERQAIPQRVARLSLQIRHAGEELVASSNSGKAAVRAALDELVAKTTAIEVRGAQVERELGALEGAEAHVVWVRAILKDFDQVWAALTRENKGPFLRSLIDSISAGNGELTITLKEVA
jgi:site-specific DNA recombinase